MFYFKLFSFFTLERFIKRIKLFLEKEKTKIQILHLFVSIAETIFSFWSDIKICLLVCYT